jgi:hypothetical protein
MVTWALNLALLGVALFALIDVLRRPAQAFPAVDRQTKIAWAIFTGLAAIIIFAFGAIDFLGVIGVIVSMFYLVDVRPKVREITGSR